MRQKLDHHYSAATRLAQALGYIDESSDGLVPPTYSSTTYLRDEDNQYRSGRVYSRADNPTYVPVERVLTSLEGGAESLLFSSGMAAATAVFQALQPGAHVIAPTVMYWALRAWLLGWAKSWGLQLSFVDTGNLDALKAAIRPTETQLIWLETPANPMWTVSDIEKICELAKAHEIYVAVDSTVATPLLTRPLELGADFVMHSATKYLNGHSDVIAGALVTGEINPLWERIRLVRKQGGAVLSPQDANQLLRGMRTMHLRVRESSRSALWLAEELQKSESVTEVLYPGLPSFPGHDVAKKQMHGGFSGMLSIRLKGGASAAIKVAAETRLWKRATSLGGVESLIEHRASIEGEGTPVPDDLLRLSVGIEDPRELLIDLLQAIDSAH
ncbi:trans-sulfuration enzyme family protein [Aliidiomarina sanyensis]|uniref:Cystathionine gamma-synthase n=1 Tax=Aliidiomarina sanyensis TaxID=1249555 RepID=A0A432WDL9_9GAMM|nr:aminotransferase class I/II-fold pyridoxal phosphate-dependent enzyme [Aliidiomarina sanyensis]RUO30511.1 cystathionine gamma-synthase [Aliidiomarina sanyensis]